MDKATFFATVHSGDPAAVREAIENDSTLAGLRWEAADGHAWRAGSTTLLAAVHSDNREIMQMLLDAGVDPALEFQDVHGLRTVAHEAYELGGPENCRLFLDAGAPYDICLAAALGDFDRVDALLREDAGRVHDTHTGLSPLGWAGYGQNARMIPYLIRRGAVDAGELVCPAGTGHLDFARAFLDAGADPNALYMGKLRPLHCAAAMPYASRNTAMVRFLLEAGADVNGLNEKGETALAVARKALSAAPDRDRGAGLQEVIALLEAEGGDL